MVKNRTNCYQSRKGNLRNDAGEIFGNTFMMAQRMEKMTENLAVPRLACAMSALHCQRLNVTPIREISLARHARQKNRVLTAKCIPLGK